MVRLLEELTDFEKLALIPMSYSRISQFHEWCQAKYFYQYVIQDESISGPQALLGNVLHSVLEECLQPNVAVQLADEEKYLQEYKKQLGEWDPDRKIWDSLVDDGVYMIREFLDRHEGDQFPIVSKEMEFQIVIGTALIRGYIDRVDVKGNTVYFTDYKSGKKEVANKGIATNLQLGIYALALQKMYPKHKIYGELYYLRSGKQKGHLFERDGLEAIERNLLSLVNVIIETEDFVPTENSRLCSFCEFAREDRCLKGYWRVSRRM